MALTIEAPGTLRTLLIFVSLSLRNVNSDTHKKDPQFRGGMNNTMRLNVVWTCSVSFQMRSKLLAVIEDQ